MRQEIAFAVLRLIPAACFGLGLLFAPGAIAQPAAGIAKTVPFDVAPLPARRCTCRDIEALVDNLYGGTAFATHQRDLQRQLNDRENQGLSRTESQNEWIAADAAFKAPPRDKGAGGGRSAATPEAATTDGITCKSVIPQTSLTRACDGFIRAMWAHERVHRDYCKARIGLGKSAFDYPGSYHANEEATAYDAGNVILRAEIERVLEESRLTVQATIDHSASSPISHVDSNFRIDLQPQGASGDGVVEFVGKGQTHFTSFRHGDCSARPLNQALAFSVRTGDMQNFTMFYKPGGPQTAPYSCTRVKGVVNQPLIPIFANQWVQPIRLQRPFPFQALVIVGGSSRGIPGLPPGISLPNMGWPQNPTASANAGIPDLTAGPVVTMVTLSCP
ncbi:hypothetical protein [Corallococcus sp. CA049B]|uniref:hypothetical protein n=1 Tax=Corallococcus sp. CA049B TaxID=2316730 RepID=UPI0011C4866F|nr:hypothetical protein [Corallococcus sp. CA049B]